MSLLEGTRLVWGEDAEEVVRSVGSDSGVSDEEEEAASIERVLGDCGSEAFGSASIQVSGL